MEVVAEILDFLLDEGEYMLAVLLVACVVLAWIWRRRRVGEDGGSKEISVMTSGRSQTNVMSDVRSKGDIHFAPRQDGG
jgi:hypothetical protein